MFACCQNSDLENRELHFQNQIFTFILVQRWPDIQWEWVSWCSTELCSRFKHCPYFKRNMLFFFYSWLLLFTSRLFRALFLQTIRQQNPLPFPCCGTVPACQYFVIQILSASMNHSLHSFKKERAVVTRVSRSAAQGTQAKEVSVGCAETLHSPAAALSIKHQSTL